MEELRVDTNRLRNKKFAQRIADSMFKKFDTGNRTTQRRVYPHEIVRAIARHMKIVREYPVLSVYSKEGGGSVSGSYKYPASADHFEIRTDPGDPLTTLSLGRGKVSSASYSRALSPFPAGSRGVSTKELKGFTLEDIKALQVAYRISKDAGDLLLRGLRKQVREDTKAHEETRRTQRREARLGKIGTYDIATCDCCGTDCARRIPVRSGGSVIMVGSSCAKHFPRARSSELLRALLR